VHTYNTKKSGTITGKAAILEPQFQTNIWVASVDATQKGINSKVRILHNLKLFQHFLSRELAYKYLPDGPLANELR